MLTVPQALQLAVQQHQAGQLAQAEQIYRAILEVEPDQVGALHLLGLLAYQRGQHERAIAYIGQALRYKPDFAQAYNSLGTVLQEQGKLDEARASLQQALRWKPDYAEALNNLGIVLKERGQLEEAAARLQQALRLKPDFAAAHTNLGNVLHQQGKLAEARACYQHALRLQPDCAEAHTNLGNVLKEQGRLEEAVAHYQHALRLRPHYAEAHTNLGNVLHQQGQLEEAVACYRHAVGLQPDCAEAHNNLGNVLKEQGQLAEAMASLQQALRLKPDYAEAHNNLGNVLKAQGKIEEALASLQQALRLKSDCADAHWNRALTWLLAGNFEQGWPEYEWRWQCKDASLPRLSQPLWDGSPLDGQTILLHAEQGLGDTLQFIRYAPLVKGRGGRVLLACQPALVRLLRCGRGIDQLISQGSPFPPFAVHAPLLSLPRIFGTTLETVPAQVPYLFADVPLRSPWREQLRGGAAFQIGIAWQGSPAHRGDRQRSIPLEQFAPLAELLGVQLVSLQRGHGSDQLDGVAGRFAVLDLGRPLEAAGGDFLDTAAAMQQLDLVITCDSALAHLAGGLGVPVWVALPFAPDWRWLRQREDSPWYPTMRLFRQQERGNWPEVFARMVDAVKQRLAETAGPRSSTRSG